MVLSGVPRKKSPVTPPGIDPGTVRLAAQRLNHYATPGPNHQSTHPLYNNIRMLSAPAYFDLIVNHRQGDTKSIVRSYCIHIACP